MPNSIKFNFDDKSKKELQEVLSITDKLFTNLEKISTKKVKVGSSKELAKEQKKANDTTKETIDLTKKYEKAIEDLRIAQSDEGREIIRLRTEKNKLNAETRKQYKEATKVLDAEEKLNKEVRDSRKEYIKLAITKGKNNKLTLEAKKRAQDLATQQLKLNAAVRNFRPNVGNYPSQLKRLAVSAKNVIGAFGVVGGVYLFAQALRNAGKVVKDFDLSMNTLAGVFRTTRKEIAPLEAEIKNIGETTVRTATQTAELAESLATLGKTPKEIIKLLRPVTDLSVGLQTTSEEAGEFLVKMLNTFGGSVDEAEEYADTIASIRTSTSLDFQKMRDSFQYLAPISKVLNKDLAYTGSLIGILADNGIKAERAGRLLGTAQQKLAAENMSLEDALGLVNQKVIDGSTELEVLAFASELFGKQAAGLGVVLASNSEIIDKNAQSIRDNGGALKDLVDSQLNTVDGAIKLVTSAWEGLILSIEDGDGIIGKLITKSLLFLANTLNDISRFLTDTSTDFKILLNNLKPLTNAFKNFVDSITSFTNKSPILSKAFNLLKDGFKFLINPITRTFKIFTFLIATVNGAISVFTELNTAIVVTFNNLKNAFSDFDFKSPIESIKRLKRVTLAQFDSFGEEVGNSFKKGYDEIMNDIESPEEKINAELPTNKSGGAGGNNKGGSGILQRTLQALETIAPKIAGKIKSIFNVENEVKKVSDAISNDLIKTIDDLAIAYENGEISAEQYLQGLEDAHKKVNDSILNDTIEMLEDKLREHEKHNTLYTEDEKEAVKALYDFKKQLRDKELKDIEDKAKKEIATEQEKAEIRKQIYQATAQAFSIIGNAIFNSNTERRNAELEQAQRAHDYEVLLAETSGATTEEINTRKRASAEKLAQKENELRRKQAKAQKEQALFNAVINTAAAVVSALATQPFLPLGPIMAGIAGALGAVQIGVIAAQPIPKFKTGVENFKGGLAVVGDGGRELVELPNKETLLVERETTLNLPKGTNVIKNAETEKRLKENNSKENLNFKPQKTVIHNHIKVNNKLTSLDYKKLRP